MDIQTCHLSNKRDRGISFMMRRGLLLLVMVLFPGVSMPAGQDPIPDARDNGWPRISLTRKAGGLKKPTHIAHAGDGSSRLFITEQEGRIIILKNFVPEKTPFLDIRDRVSCCGERGLLSVAFPPGYAKKRYLYVNYTNKNGDTVVARYWLTADSDQADPKSEEMVLFVKQPFPNHNGGQLAFGPDGFLYIGMGDGGAAGDLFKNGQNPDKLLGKILRIDVESKTKPYAIPLGNPFINKKGHRPEIWALGLRNPWRFSFDRATGDLYIADVGQNKYEEVHVQPVSSPGGENYGWDIMEGMHCFQSKKCDTTGLVMPVVEYGHGEGCSITGGMVYRAREFPSLQGIYFYSDYCSGRVWGLRQSGGQWRTKELLKSGLAVSTFGEDEDGNIYLADYDNGVLYKVDFQQGKQ
jgi:glucose/arabinose dehydrogenase